MFLDHGRSSAAQGLSGSDEIQRLQLKDLTADNPGHAHPVKTAVNDEDGNQAGTDFLPVSYTHLAGIPRVYAL